MKNKSIAAFCLCLILLCSVILTGCKNNSSVILQEKDEEITTTASVTTSQISSTTEAKATKPTEESTTTSPKTTTPPQKETEPKPAQKPNNNNSNNNNNNNSGSDSGPVDSKPMTCIVTVDGKDYTAEYGDILTYTYYLKTPKTVECIQASVSYTPNCLQLMDDKIETTLPVIHSGAIFNGEMQGTVNYNAINLSGYDFTTEGVLITLRFKVVFGGSGSINNAIQYLDEKGGNVSYVDNFKMSDVVEFREVLK